MDDKDKRNRARYTANMKRLMESRGVSVEDIAGACHHRPETVARWLECEGRGFSVGDVLSINRSAFPDIAVASFMSMLIEPATNERG